MLLRNVDKVRTKGHKEETRARVWEVGRWTWNSKRGVDRVWPRDGNKPHEYTGLNREGVYLIDRSWICGSEMRVWGPLVYLFSKNINEYPLPHYFSRPLSLTV